MTLIFLAHLGGVGKVVYDSHKDSDPSYFHHGRYEEDYSLSVWLKENCHEQTVYFAGTEMMAHVILLHYWSGICLHEFPNGSETRANDPSPENGPGWLILHRKDLPHFADTLDSLPELKQIHSTGEFEVFEFNPKPEA